MPQYSSQHFLTATSFDKLSISTRVDYGFSEFMYQTEGKWPPDKPEEGISIYIL